MQETLSVHAHGADDDDYHRWLATLDAEFQRRMVGKQLFTTDTSNLWATYLAGFNGKQRQYHNCNACRQFIERFGGLVVATATGETYSPLWDDISIVPSLYVPSVAGMQEALRIPKITGVFLADEDIGVTRRRIVRTKTTMWGTPQTGMWRHFAVTAPAQCLVKAGGVKNAHQVMAEKAGDFATVKRALFEISPDTLQIAVSLLKGEQLFRSEKVLGQAEWLLNLQFAANRTSGPTRDAVIWHAVASAPAGFCHPRSSMIATLLEDLAGGMGMGQAAKRFAEKMDPLRYQRPQAAPKAGTIEQAEKLVAQMGIERSLERRMALASEVQTIWMPHATKPRQNTRSSVFSHLKPLPTPEKQLVAGDKVITWVKFAGTVLPGAAEIEVFVHASQRSFSTLVTAAHADAPPLLQWDSLEQRNPFSWYFWHGGTLPNDYSLVHSKFHKVIGITLKPNMWHGRTDHHGQGALFMIQGARDVKTPPLCLFPEFLRSELHGVRAVIEAHSARKKAAHSARGLQEAAGILLHSGVPWNLTVRVTSTSGVVTEYTIDRWD